MEGHNTMVVLNFVAWLAPKLCCRVQHGNGSVEIKCGDDSWTHCTMAASTYGFFLIKSEIGNDVSVLLSP